MRYVYANGIEMIHNEFEPDLKADCVFEGTAGTILVSRDGIRSKPHNHPRKADREERQNTSLHQTTITTIGWRASAKARQTICPAEVGHRSASICHLGSIAYKLGRELPGSNQRTVCQRCRREQAPHPRTPGPNGESKRGHRRERTHRRATFLIGRAPLKEPRTK